MQFPEISKDKSRAREIAVQVLEVEIEGIRSVMDRLDNRFDECVDLLYSLRGRIIITGVGKSGIIARKMAATLTSTGTPSIFVHPVDGLHGDMGIVSRDDALLAISNSGETTEITALTATAKRRGMLIVAMTGSMSSTLARMADLTLDSRVPREACPLNMAPTASTTAALALGDALAVALMVRRGFSKEDFLRHHPAGSLGERLSLRVRDIMLDRRAAPSVGEETPLDKILSSISRQNLGFTLVTRGDRLLGIITDGDLRRALARGPAIHQCKASELMTPKPLTIRDDRTAAEA
ncbi:MAG: KpsF/GutQ family sugar-phosphate isomerase, partial [Deltaproteobacteria bacterium]|nr:KpsF/GutQ family sugar-phosphate isomerase [Deltaproteobacteria bacterium]